MATKNLTVEAVDELLMEYELLRVENERLRSLVIRQQNQVKWWRGAAQAALYALRALNKAAGPVLTQIEIVRRPKKGE